MKTFKSTLRFSAFLLGATAAFATTSLSTEEGVFGKNSLGQCIAAVETMESGCSLDGQHQCTVYLESAGEVAPAYSIRIGDCILPLRRNY